MDIPFAKLQGAGNGYVVIDGRELTGDWSALARDMTDPHFGVGSDGLAIVQHSECAQVRMRIFNSDGSESEMSGNGIRLFAKFVIDRKIAAAGSRGLSVETGGGIRQVSPTLAEGRVLSARVAMGAPTFEPAAIPALLPADLNLRSARLFDHPLELVGETIRVTCLAIGNPHAVALLDEPVADFPLERIGPLVQNHPLFPNRINFEVVNVIDRSTLRARVFERGEGETLSSGTGSTASAIAARAHDLCDDEVEVQLAGGTLRVHWPGSGEAELEGPAVEVFSGIWRTDLLC